MPSFPGGCSLGGDMVTALGPSSLAPDWAARGGSPRAQPRSTPRLMPARECNRRVLVVMLAVLNIGVVPQNARPHEYPSVGQVPQQSHVSRPTGTLWACLGRSMQERMEASGTAAPCTAG